MTAAVVTAEPPADRNKLVKGHDAWDAQCSRMCSQQVQTPQMLHHRIQCTAGLFDTELLAAAGECATGQTCKKKGELEDSTVDQPLATLDATVTGLLLPGALEKA